MTDHHRKLILVDLENLLGCSPMSADSVTYERAYRRLTVAIPPARQDLVIIGVNPAAAFPAYEVDSHARIVIRGGADGAETRLIEELADVGRIRRRFGEVVIASGDHRFVEPVEALTRHGIVTTVASLPTQLSTRLRLAARSVVLLTDTLTSEAA